MSENKQVPLPDWCFKDDLGGLVPSEIRVSIRAYGDAVLSASAGAVPEGYALVPLRPTDAMLDAINDAPWYIEESVHWNGEALIRKQITRPNARYIIDGWDAMLKAASKSNQEQSTNKEGE